MFSANSIYIQVFQSRFVIKNIDTDEKIEVARDQSHASPRMLIADFTTAEHQLKQAVKSIRRGLIAPAILMHPMELIEGGLTQVEYRVFRELALGAGASKTAVYAGAPLSAEEVKKTIREYK